MESGFKDFYNIVGKLELSTSKIKSLDGQTLVKDGLVIQLVQIGTILSKSDLLAQSQALMLNRIINKSVENQDIGGIMLMIINPIMKI